MQWFDNDPPGLDPTAPARSLWAREISLRVNQSRTSFQRRNPQLVFIKTLKVGGTTVAIALDNVAKRYGIPLQRGVTETANRQAKLARQHCTPGGSLYFHHGFRNAWMTECMPHARFTALLREPLAQALSWETFLLSRDYYHAYPQSECTEDVTNAIVLDDDDNQDYTYIQLRQMLHKVTSCRNTALRKRITLRMLAYRVGAFNGGPGQALRISKAWLLGGVPTKTSNLLATLRDEYFLVGVTPRVNEFLLLLALHMGWDPTTLYYIHCKPTDLDIKVSEFKLAYPTLYQRMEQALVPATKVYNKVEADFAQRMTRLKAAMPEFDGLLQSFTQGLKQYQAKQASSSSSPYRWKKYRYGDGHTEYC